MIRICSNNELINDQGIYVLFKHDPINNSAYFLDPVIIYAKNDGRVVRAYEGKTNYKSRKKYMSYTLGVGDYICRIAYRDPLFINDVIRHMIQLNHMPYAVVEIVDADMKDEMLKMINRVARLKGE